ncbi:uncharacterized protein PGTG_00824 [Puccinia graminis f. sp. tritici CRL 75-36-700-3]|uniref:Uncharacterized protein n=1 Tax=Puccinia graminis f. sp. tritici (strain CRL 75-36-700-3 / race SCCL) TaxID=418459 RepID=E3JTS6_PUCGT|nr:uncharacterized protein PGTG_00824 [Puccinia graminis f. sp. tritici CRL 75-36-700-3]EFP75493.1 hypothetical protein PGTG_00824 [Puccinia graminis f. sp. tritici CRL 75-36-700-3]
MLSSFEGQDKELNSNNKLVYRPACWKGFLPTSWFENRLDGRNPSQQAGIKPVEPCKVSRPGGTPPGLKTPQGYPIGPRPGSYVRRLDLNPYSNGFRLLVGMQHRTPIKIGVRTRVPPVINCAIYNQIWGIQMGPNITLVVQTGP